MTFETTRNAISSPASAVGAMRSGSPAGPTTGPCGPDRVLANLSPRQALEKGLMTRDTYGRTGDGSSISAGLQSSLESRLRAKMAAYGSPEDVLNWKHGDMPSAPPSCARRASVSRTSGNGFTGWPTPNAMPPNRGGLQTNPQKALERRQQGHQFNLDDAARLAGWATPTSRDHKDGEYCPNVPTNCLLGRQAWLTGSP